MNDEQIKLELDKFVGLEEAQTVIKQRWDDHKRWVQWIDPAKLETLSDDELRNKFLEYFNEGAGRHQFFAINRDRIIKDIKKFKTVMKFLLDESIPVKERLNDILEKNGEYNIVGMGKGLVTSILMDLDPMHYAIWNNRTDEGLQALDLSPQFERGDDSGTRYERVMEKVRHIKELKPEFSFLEVDYFLHTVYEKPPVIIGKHVLKPNNISESTKIDQLKNLLESKPQIILAGPPGTSKTYMAFQLIALLGNEEFGIEEDPNDSIFKPPYMQFDSPANLIQNETKVVWDIVQFHPSYGYEDFISGIEANSENGALNFERKKRIFIKIVEAAKENPSIKYVLIIDEINRGFLGRIFGELILTLEYRNLGVRLLGQNERITIPDNLYLIGTMNTADRNISLVDHALRRRFLIVQCLPDGDLLNEYLENNSALDDSKLNTIKEIFQAVQKAFYRENTQEYVRDQRGYFMGDYAIGHTYFMTKDLEDLWTNLRYQVIPLLEEYRKEGIITEDHLRSTAQIIQEMKIDPDPRGNVSWLKDWCKSVVEHYY